MGNYAGAILTLSEEVEFYTSLPPEAIFDRLLVAAPKSGGLVKLNFPVGRWEFSIYFSCTSHGGHPDKAQLIKARERRGGTERVLDKH